MGRRAVNGVHLHVETWGSGPPLLLLHGFTGSAATWAPHLPCFAARARVVALDLLGHGESDAPRDADRYRMARAAEDLAAVLDGLGIDAAAVLGYSMGGRLALYLASAAPERVRALIAVSASPGVRDEEARRARRINDAALAAAIEREGVRAFVDRWEREPLFATQHGLPAAVRAAIRADRLRHSAVGLANSLRGMGQGAQPPLHDWLPGLRMPALIVAGALDSRYCGVAREMQASIPGSRLAIVPEAGHAPQWEQPVHFQRMVLSFLDTIAAEPAAKR